MLSLFGFLIPVPSSLGFLTYPIVQFGVNAAAWLLFAFLVNFVLLRIMRYITRQIPGDLEDIIFAILRGPLVFLILVYGAVSSLDLLSLPFFFQRSIRLITYTIVILIVAHIFGRTIRDVLVYYGGKWARKSDSRVDDVMIPVLNLFGPVVIVITAALLILPMWGINVTSVLVGAGVIGIVLGLALQETLSNVFSGLSLLVEAPFRTGDLIITPDGRMCEVQRIGMRSTELYSITEHATVYIPNRTLTGAILTNVTRPTIDQKFFLEVEVGAQAELSRTEELLRRIAVAHPAVLVVDFREKVPYLREQIAKTRNQADKLGEDDPSRTRLLREAEYNERVIPRLEIEGNLNFQLSNLQELLRGMIRGIKAREGKGLSENERKDIQCNFIAPIEDELKAVTDLARIWTEAEDPWLDDSDYWNLRWVWKIRNDLLDGQWEKVKKAINHPDDRLEMRLDDVTVNMLEWIKREYKVPPAYWKDPRVTLKNFVGDHAILELSFYVDNIRLEHDNRPSRVRTEIGRQIHNAIWGNS